MHVFFFKVKAEKREVQRRLDKLKEAAEAEARRSKEAQEQAAAAAAAAAGGSGAGRRPEAEALAEENLELQGQLLRAQQLLAKEVHSMLIQAYGAYWQWKGKERE